MEALESQAPTLRTWQQQLRVGTLHSDSLYSAHRLAPRGEDLLQAAHRLAPRGEGLLQPAHRLAPRGEDLLQPAHRLAPRGEDLLHAVQVLAPRGEHLFLSAHTFAPRGEVMARAHSSAAAVLTCWAGVDRGRRRRRARRGRRQSPLVGPWYDCGIRIGGKLSRPIRPLFFLSAE